MISQELHNNVEVVPRSKLSISSFPSHVTGAAEDWSALLNEAYGKGYQFGGIIEQRVGAEIFPLVVFNKMPSSSKSVKRSA